MTGRFILYSEPGKFVHIGGCFVKFSVVHLLKNGKILKEHDNEEHSMNFLKDMFVKPYPSHAQAEVEKLTEELIRIGKTEDFLSERPGQGFNRDCRHIRTRDIGKRLDDLGGLPLMTYVNRQVRRKIGKNLSWHLEAAWKDIGDWIA
jgi:hypothetical protein